MSHDLDKKMSEVTDAVFTADARLRAALEAMRKLEAAELAIAEHADACYEERGSANRGVGFARIKAAVLESLLFEPLTPTEAELTKMLEKKAEGER